MDSLTLDISVYDRPTWNAKCIYDQGVRNIIFGVFSHRDAPNQLRQMAAEWRAVGGNILGFYGLVYFGGGDHYVFRDIKWAVQLAKEFNVSDVFIDCEADARDIKVSGAINPTPQRRLSELKRVREYIEQNSLQPWIYTYESFWQIDMANSHAYKDLPLWFARYGSGGAPIGPIETVHFGGWTKCRIHQYTSVKIICNRGRDFNYLFDAPEEDLSAEQYNELKNKIEDLIVQLYSTPERLEELRSVGSLEGRVDRMEKQGGWLDSRLDMIEERIVELEEGGVGAKAHHHTTGKPIYE